MATNENAKQQAAMLGEPWVSSNLLGNLDPEYCPGPEEDFYVNENREWLLKGEIEDGQLQNMPLIMGAMNTIKDRCAELLAGENSDEPDIRSAQNYYKLLRNWELRDRIGVAPLDEALARIDAVSSIAELNELFCDPDPMRRLDFFTPDTGMDLLDGSVYTAYASFSILDMENDEDAAEYTNPTPTGLIMRKRDHDIFAYIAAQTCIADRAEEIWETRLAWMAEICAHYPTQADLAVPGVYQAMGRNRMTKAELVQFLGDFPTERVLEVRGYGDVDQFVVMVRDGDGYLAAHYDEEHLAGIKAFLMVKLVDKSRTLLTSDITVTAKRIASELLGTTFRNDEIDQRRKAFDTVYEVLPTPVSKLYVSHYADDSMRQEVRRLCDDIVSVYKDMLKGEEWLSESTRAYAIEKLDAMHFRVLYTDAWEDYSKLDIRSAAEGETPWTAWLKVVDYKERYMRSLLGEQVDDELMPKCIDTNCNYNQYNNSVNIYLGFLSDVTFTNDMTIEQKLGGLGMVVGHEISHGFDTTGMLCDKNGNEADWWTEEDKAAYDVRTKRAMDWYEQVYKPRTETMPGIGLRCIGETFADLGALSAAMTLARGIEGFDYDKFFRAFAHVWTRIDNEFAFDYMLRTDEHPMGNLRVNLTLAQCDEFHKTYGVKPGDKMYFAPEDRLRLW